VLICADLSHHGLRVVREGVRFAALEKAPVVLLYVIDDRFPYPDLFSLDHPDENFYQALREKALEHLRRWAREAGAPHGTEFLVARGKPSTVIVDLAQERRPVLLVVGAHGLSRRHGHSLGATAERVARDTPCSILIVHTGDE
jgi:nucleotide-binding universal stress UspA family protein